MMLGNLAISAFLLWQLLRLPAGARVEDLLLRPRSEPRA